jgi:hypothetical protein
MTAHVGSPGENQQVLSVTWVENLIGSCVLFGRITANT